MARQCAICGKKKTMGNHRKLLRGHMNITGRRSFRPNLQKTKVDGASVLACVQCMHNANKIAVKKSKVS